MLLVLVHSDISLAFHPSICPLSISPPFIPIPPIHSSSIHPSIFQSFIPPPFIPLASINPFLNQPFIYPISIILSITFFPFIHTFIHSSTGMVTTNNGHISSRIQQLLNTLKRPKNLPFKEFFVDDEDTLESKLELFIVFIFIFN